MKKNILVILFTLFAIFTSFAQTEIGSIFFQYGRNSSVGFKCTLVAGGNVTNYENYAYNLVNQPSYDGYTSIIQFASLEQLQLFRTKLIELSKKYEEWSQVAQQNNVTDMTKIVPIDLGIQNVLVYYGTQQVANLKTPLKVIYRAKHNNLEIYPQNQNAVLMLVIERIGTLSKLIDLMSSTNVKTALFGSTNQDSLFN